MQPVLATDFKIASSSKGLIVWILIISALIPFSAKAFPASIAGQTKCPVATIVTSVPSFNSKAFPITKGVSSEIKIGIFGLPNLK